jgi:hypothetical protein
MGVVKTAEALHTPGQGPAGSMVRFAVGYLSTGKFNGTLVQHYIQRYRVASLLILGNYLYSPPAVKSRPHSAMLEMKTRPRTNSNRDEADCAQRDGMNADAYQKKQPMEDHPIRYKTPTRGIVVNRSF